MHETPQLKAKTVGLDGKAIPNYTLCTRDRLKCKDTDRFKVKKVEKDMLCQH